MKRIFLISLLVLVACNPPSVIPEPEPDNPPVMIKGAVSIAYLKTLYTGAPTKITDELLIAGRVVSSDVRGNFYKTLVLDDGTGGIELKLDLEEIFKHFMIHTLVTVRCNGLWLGSYGGTLQLGTEPYDDFQTQYIPEGDIPLHLTTDDSFTDEVLPRQLVIGELSPRDISTFACFQGVQFVDEEQGLGWADASAEHDTDRHLVDGAGNSLVVRTSRFADFARRTLPEGSGSIEGVVGYFNGTYQLRVCDDQKAEMYNPRF
jgi:hypothetical protein